MAKKDYDWENGAILDDHTKIKHSILSEYFRQYLITRCKMPQREKFRIAIVDGFSGAGKYKCGNYGSPLIFIETLDKTLNEINIYRASQGMRSIVFECLLIFNDSEQAVVDKLKENCAPLLAAIKESNQKLQIQTEFLSSEFEALYPEVRKRVIDAKCSNVFFNLDQCGYSQVTTTIIRDIMTSWRSAEIILTFMVKSMLTYISPDAGKSAVPLEPEIQNQIQSILDDESGIINKPNWLGNVELIVFDYLKSCAPYVSPFSINNPEGWRYWLMHFANSYKARQIYNNVLHENENAQAHFGKPGLKMLSYDPKHEGQLYLFDTDSRTAAKEALYDEIPSVVAEAGDALSVEDFYKVAYSATPAHSDDIHSMIIENPDIAVVTEAGSERRKPNTIKTADTLKIRGQKSMFFMFDTKGKK